MTKTFLGGVAALAIMVGGAVLITHSSATSAATPAAKPQLGSFGVDLTAMDKSG